METIHIRFRDIFPTSQTYTKMNFLRAMFTFIAAALLPPFLALSALLLRIFIGKSIRSPKYPPVAGTVFHQLLYFGWLYDYQAKVAKTCPTFRLLAPGQSLIYTTDIRNIEHILKTKFEKYSKGQYTQDILRDLFGQGIFAVDGDKWRHQRKLASFEFSTRVLRDFSCAVFRRNSAKLVRFISELSAADKVFDIQDLLMRCTLDSMFKVGFGVDLNCLERSSKDGSAFIKAFDDSNELVSWRFVDPFWKLKKFMNTGSEASLKKNVKVIDDFVHSLISTKKTLLEAQHANNDKEDILSRFLVESEKDPEGMNDRYLRDIILNFLLAGKDSSANTLSWFFYMLCKNPLIQEKTAREVKQVTGSQCDPASIDDFIENITDEVLEKMHYLHSALTETLRLYPAVPVDGRCAEEDDILPDGYQLKKGDDVYYMSYAMGRMPYIWGDDAEDFKPERWLDNNGIFQPQSPFKFIAFHAGPRMCLGKDFAYRQIKIMSMALLRFFRFKLADETRNVTYRTMLTLHISGGLHLCATPRTGLS
ncbi:cytochrome P450 704C1-like [Diospyros lotus]|uniref:cytochrome P450 704C1-like n=1 Tax=Diospyros lotus TaxID=55363 RepID=UPI002252A687|nr:cytochrome P450 704C1-like [Diospyros lotus]